MRIAVDIRPLCHDITGIGRYTLNVLGELLRDTQHQWFLYSDRPARADLPRGEHIVCRAPARKPPLPGALTTQWLFPYWCRRDAIDVFWAPGQHLPLYLPRRVRRVVTIHDLVWLEQPQTMTAKGRLLDSLLIARGARRADHVLSVSESTGELLRDRLGIPPSRITVTRHAPTPLAPGQEPRSLESLAGRPFILFVGTIEPRKNLAALLTAFKALRQSRPELLLVVCGAPGWGGETLESVIRRLELQGSVVATGYLPDEELHGLYRDCQALAMPSLYEGFGLPALEALAYGKPVVVTPHTEIARLEHPLVHVCADTGPEAIRHSLETALASPAEEPPPLGLSWTETAKKTLQVLTCQPG